jgi:hypothetical protein
MAETAVADEGQRRLAIADMIGESRRLLLRLVFGLALTSFDQKCVLCWNWSRLLESLFAVYGPLVSRSFACRPV